MRILLLTSGYNSVIRQLLTNPTINIVGIAMASNYSGPAPLAIRARHKARDAYYRIYHRRNLPVFELSRDNQDAFAEWIRKLAPDITIIYSCPFLLQQEVLQLPSLGTVNLHNSELPKYRGPQPLMWQYLDFDLRCGVTLHHADARGDTGDIINQRSFQLELGTPFPVALSLLESEGHRLLVDSIRQLETGTATRRVQPQLSSTKRAKRLTKEEIRAAINWREWPVEQLFHCLRGIKNLTPVLPLNSFIPSDEQLVAADFSQYVQERYPPGELLKEQSNYRLICKNGVINIQKQANKIPSLQRLVELF